MKTAEYFVAAMRADRATPSLEDDLQWIKRIQADALATAAEICLEVAQRRVDNDATDCAQAIIAEAEKLNL